MINILLLEDNVQSLKVLKKIVESVSAEITTVAVSSLEEAREALMQKHQTFQAFLLDINLNVEDEADESGIVLAKEIRRHKQYAFTPIVMITSIANLELQAYRELHCYQYILKPYQQQEIVKLIHKLLFQTGESIDASIVVKKDGINYKLLCKDIIYVQAIPRGVSIRLAKEEMKVPYLSIKQLMEKLPTDQFIQCHRMYVVNQDYIEYVDMVNGMIKLQNDEQVEIGVTYKNEVRSRLHG